MGYTSGSPANAQACGLQHWAIIEPSTDNRNQLLRSSQALFWGLLNFSRHPNHGLSCSTKWRQKPIARPIKATTHFN
jgi:hypothetical protein